MCDVCCATAAATAAQREQPGGCCGSSASLPHASHCHAHSHPALPLLFLSVGQTPPLRFVRIFEYFLRYTNCQTGTYKVMGSESGPVIQLWICNKKLQISGHEATILMSYRQCCGSAILVWILSPDPCL